MDQLQPFASHAASDVFHIRAGLEFRSDTLHIRYRVEGPIDQLVLPEPVTHPGFRDELWMTTCLEIFLQPLGQSSYEEWNFSPSGNWAHYHFSAYRQPFAGAQRGAPREPLQWTRGADQLLLSAMIPQTQKDLNYGLTAVLHLKSGEKQYWALRHAGEKPDFHLAASFQGSSRPG